MSMPLQKLVTVKIAEELKHYPLRSTDGVNASSVLLKFSCNNHKWYVLEAEQAENGDFKFFGLIDGLERELGYFTLSQLLHIQEQMGIVIERDIHFKGFVVDKTKREVRKVRCSYHAR